MVLNACQWSCDYGTLTAAKYAKDPTRYFAERLRKALKEDMLDLFDLNSDADDSLIRLVVSHSEVTVNT